MTTLMRIFLQISPILHHYTTFWLSILQIYWTCCDNINSFVNIIWIWPSSQIIPEGGNRISISIFATRISRKAFYRIFCSGNGLNKRVEKWKWLPWKTRTPCDEHSPMLDICVHINFYPLRNLLIRKVIQKLAILTSGKNV